MTQTLYVNPHHVFEHGDRCIVYDLIHGGFFEADAVVQDILLACDGLSVDGLVLLLADRYNQAVVRHTCFELVEAGLLSEDFPESLRPFVPPGRMEVVQLGLNLTGGVQQVPQISNGKQAMTLDVAHLAVDLLLEVSGYVRDCRLCFYGGDGATQGELVVQTVVYAHRQAQRLGKRVGAVLYGEQWVGHPMVGACQVQGIDVVVEVPDDNQTELLKIKGADSDLFLDEVDRPDVDRSALLDVGESCLSNGQRLSLATASDFTQEDLPEVLNKLEALAKSVVQYPNGQWIDGLEDAMVQVYNRLVAYYYCGAGTRFLTVTPEGKLYVCPNLTDQDQFCVGDVHTGIQYEKLGTWIKSSHVDQFEACASCWARYLCGGGCRFKSFVRTERIDQPDPHTCTFIRRSYELAMATCLELADRDPALLSDRYVGVAS